DILKDYRKPGYDSGFDGTIIHLYCEESKINQVITIARGREFDENDNWRPLDWTYNLTGVFSGRTEDQYRELENIHAIVLQDISAVDNNKLTPVKVFGFGHSLGEGLIKNMQLLTGRFYYTYSFNPARPSFYQLALKDQYYRDVLSIRFGIKNLE